MRPYLLTLASIAALACGGGGDDGGPTENNGPDGDIIVNNNFFSPANFSTSVGSQVTWAWAQGSALHDIVFEDGAPGSNEMTSGTFNRTFNAPGTYNYFCQIHTAAVMSGVVNVTASGQGGSGGGSGGGGSGGGGSGGGGGYPTY
jgi:plastocyanin